MQLKYDLHTCFVAMATQPQTTRITTAAAAIHLPSLTVTPHASKTVTKQDISWYLTLQKEGIVTLLNFHAQTQTEGS